jgi:hypothetical protein
VGFGGYLDRKEKGPDKRKKGKRPLIKKLTNLKNKNFGSLFTVI